MISKRLTALPNAFLLLISLYFMANLFWLLSIALGREVVIENNEYVLSLDSIIISSLILFTLIFLYFISYRCFIYNTRREKNTNFGWKVSSFLLAIQISYMFYCMYFGVDVAGVKSDHQEVILFHYLFWAAQPDLLFIILSVGLKSERWFWANSLAYVSSTLYRGWIGGVFLLAVLVIIRHSPISISRASLKRLFFVFGLLLLLLPIVVALKWFLRQGMGFQEAIDFLIEYGYSNYLLDSIWYVLDRFQHLSHVALIFDNAQTLAEAYKRDEFIPYYADGILQWIYLKVSGIEIVNLNKFIVREIFGSANEAYSTNPGLAGWLLILPMSDGIVFVLYVIAITVFPAFFIVKYAGYKYYILFNCMSLVYLFHGWFGAHVNFVVYMCAITALCKLRFRSNLVNCGHGQTDNNTKGSSAAVTVIPRSLR